MNFGERLKDLRLEKNLSLEKLAEKIEVHRTTISLWERGKIDITSFYLIKLANFFEVTTDYLLGIEN